MKAIDWTLPVETCDGRKVDVLCTDARGSDPVWLRVESSNGDHVFYTSKLSGVRCGDSKPFFRNVPEKFERVVWLSIYPNNIELDVTRQSSDINAGDRRIARIRVPITGHVGQFDE